MGVHRSRRIVIAVVLVAVAITAAWELAPWAPTTHAPAFDAAMETTAGISAVLVAFLLLGRFRLSRRLSDLALACSLGVLGLSHTFYLALPAALNDGAPTAWSAWAAICGHLSAGVIFAVAALAGERSVDRRTERRTIAVSAALFAGAALGSLLLAPAGPPQQSATVAGSIVNGIAVAAFAAVAYLFARTAERRSDELLTWVALGAGLAAVARLNYIFHPTLYNSGVGLGDGLRLLDHAALVVGGSREITRLWRTAAAAAVAEERRRIARDFHDGIGQELAFIARRVNRMAGQESVAREVAEAARRALVDARRAISALRDVDEDEDLAAALLRIGAHAARGTGADVTVDVAAGLRLGPAERDEIGRIVGEAVANAVHHGRARQVRIELTAGGNGLLSVSDDGAGFDPATPPPAGGFGIEGMRERAERVGGQLVLRSGPAGTEVKVVLVP